MRAAQRRRSGGARRRPHEVLVTALKALSRAADLETVTAVVRTAARRLAAADGATFLLREGDQVYYADEDAIAPLWKGRRFSDRVCIGGWCMRHRETLVIEDIEADPRIPLDCYRETFIKSLAMVPIRPEAPLGAIGVYWARRHQPTPAQLEYLQSLADAAAVALTNVELVTSLRRAVAARDEFMDVAAHELRTPLTPLKLSLQQLGRRVSDAPARQELERALRHLQRLERLVQALIDTSTLAHEPLALDVQDVDLAALVRDAAAATARDDAPLVVDAPPALLGRWDPVRLEQVVAHLVGNAVLYGERTTVVVSLRSEGPADQVRLTVTDRGRGIPARDQARLFERFERGVSAKHFGGLGQGLWVVRRLVEAHGGLIDVASAPGEGTTFTVRLPRRTDDAGPRDAGASSASRSVQDEVA